MLFLCYNVLLLRTSPISATSSIFPPKTGVTYNSSIRLFLSIYPNVCSYANYKTFWVVFKHQHLPLKKPIFK